MTMKNKKKINAKDIDEENDIKIVSTTTMTLCEKTAFKKNCDNYSDETLKYLLYPNPFTKSVLYCKDESNQSASLSEEKRTVGNAAFAKKQASASIPPHRRFGSLLFQRGRKSLLAFFWPDFVFYTYWYSNRNIYQTYFTCIGL
jgi:hypothetical protein